MNPEQIHVELPGLHLRAKRWGSRAGIPVLALHGWLDNANTFDRLLAHLDGDGLLGHLNVVALDLPGHGHSAHRISGPYHFIDAVADVLAAADALQWERFSLLGHSMGAGIATLLAGSFPRRVRRMALVEGLGPLTDAEANAPTRLARSLQVEKRKRQRTGGKRVYETESIAAEHVAQATGMRVESARILVTRGLKAVDGGFIWRADARLRIASRQRLSEAQLHAFLRAVECPTRLLTATEGYPRDAESLAARIACLNAEFDHFEVEGSHHVHLDHPDRVAGPLGPFLAEQDG